jgi:hypothetical protein
LAVFNIFAPRISPTARSMAPIRRAVIATTISGSDVPMAKNRLPTKLALRL